MARERSIPPPLPEEDPEDDGGTSTFRPAPKPRDSSESRSSSTFRSRSTSSGSTRSHNEDEPKPGRAPIAEARPGRVERWLFGSIGTADLARFCRQLSSYLDAGVALPKALANIQAQFSTSTLGPIIGRVLKAIRQGSSLGDAFTAQRGAFDPLFLSLVRVAETRGHMPEILKLLAHHYEARVRLYRQARSALIYPATVLVLAAGLATLLLVVVLPIMVKFLDDFRQKAGELPMPTKVLMAIGDFMSSIGWFVVPGVLIGIPIVLWRMYKTPAGKRSLDTLALRVPVFGQMLKLIDTTRFARTLSALLEGGVALPASLDLTVDVMRLDPYRRAVGRMRRSVVDGMTLSEAAEESGRFDHQFIAVLDSGEETGSIPEVLAHLADQREEELGLMVKNLGSLLQPLILLALGGLVLFLILAVFLPYLSILQNLSG